jgi:hypothetical protein
MRNSQRVALQGLFRQLVVQGEGHSANVAEVYKLLKEACEDEFIEDNEPTLRAFLTEQFNKAWPTQETSAVRCSCKDFPGADQFCNAHTFKPAPETCAAPEKPLFQARFCEYKGELVQRSDGVMVCPECGNQS